MRFKGKKLIFNYRDSYAVDLLLDPVICGALMNFKEVISRLNEEQKVPMTMPEGYIEDGEDWEEGWAMWMADIDAMIYAFDHKNCPIPPKGLFEFEEEDTGRARVAMVVDTGDELSRFRYFKDMKLWRDRVDYGRRLFIELYENLWW